MAAEREYDEVVVLWDYLYTHFKDRLSETEQKAGRVMIFDGNCPFQSAGGDPARDAEIRFEFGSTDPSVFGALAEGKRRFMEQAAARVLQRNGPRSSSIAAPRVARSCGPRRRNSAGGAVTIGIDERRWEQSRE